MALNMPLSALAVQSWCLRNFKDNMIAAKMVRECGLQAIELCGVHADFITPGKLSEVAKIYADQGVAITAIGVEGFGGAPERDRHRCENVVAAGIKYISADLHISAFPQCLAESDKLAQEFGLKFAFHNHGGQHWLGSPTMLEYCFKQSSPALGLCLDTAWMMDSGVNPLSIIERFGERLYGLHLKDFIFDLARQPRDVVLGCGFLDLPQLFALLKKVNFSGYLTLEYEADADCPQPAIRACIERVRPFLQ